MFDRQNARASTMRNALVALVAGALLSTTALTASRAQTAEPAPTPPAAMQERDGPSAQARSGGENPRDGARGERRGERADRHGKRHHADRRGGRGGYGMGFMMNPAKVASGLAALETGIGITSDQMDVWREFSSAAVAFAAASRPSHGPRGERWRDRDEAPEAGQAPNAATGGEAASGAQRTPFDRLERITSRAIASGEAARTLQSAAETLQQSLTPEQIDTARTLMRSMMREARMEQRGHHGKGGRHGGHGDHHGQRG
ncbi:Spy/CpxP family protein refolding chaperone [Fulvimarina sp. 2208YS6-2-32]|uniref:Spy/CpxP family protein refolding chaperone n=1 Tax=Fulvimarina uroteuthidis TaxID=3098149 RepID=A0ABU5I475_9HYPH|nr:Spy/CpxP family protein refolding chaperone [Fulvimarina sp. 2208YS6-2-32]MDY8110006.1 Spy/CpxP family protein refolding chaperone [Fulvimarina sp. 2208YS6-2-32]